ncbi:UDP-2,4-diacetamido-2,4,6-trideoxy-beta-L-altropyranose hydrolase [Sporosarcina sp. FSL K6-5500]|uniref:UDP-2,4-diacetamido-2,4, 6-trideoxy-beta-L-altropyranose hydrolase n=1 Tax=Sporosarcina sp. FSL K6-5500 TaxID=2921558 RepID=UPI0030F80238
MNIVIRTDASIEIGTGHVMRCLTLANQFKRHGAEVTFVCRNLEGNSISYLQSQGMQVAILPSVKNDVQWKSDAEATRAIIEDLNIEVDLIIVDHYELDNRWESILRLCTKQIMVIDDLANRSHDCDLLLDQNYYLNMRERYRGLAPDHCVQMLGPDHVLLRDEFLQVANKPRERTGEVHNILIFFGGTDPTGETIKTLEAIREINIPEIEINVVVGASNPKRHEIEQMCNKMQNTNFYCQVSNMAEMMWKADLAIGAGGATTWERCFLGLPTLTTVIADNQLEATTFLNDQEVTVYVGESKDTSSEMIKQPLIKLLNCSKEVRKLSRNSLRIIDSVRVQEYIVLNMIKQVLGGLK